MSEEEIECREEWITKPKNTHDLGLRVVEYPNYYITIDQVSLCKCGEYHTSEYILISFNQAKKLVEALKKLTEREVENENE